MRRSLDALYAAAGALAALRERPRPGLTEMLDAADSVMAGSTGLALIERELVVGDAIGDVPDDAPQVPLARDLAAQQRATIAQLQAELDAAKRKAIYAEFVKEVNTELPVWMPIEQIFVADGPPGLTLITCGGAFDRGVPVTVRDTRGREIDGACVGEPWNARAINDGIGFTSVTTSSSTRAW